VRAGERKPAFRRPRILCTGIAVLDQVFRVAAFPERDAKTRALEFISVVGGGAANAAIAIVRLGGAARFAGPLGDGKGQDPIGDRILAGLAAEGVDCACARVDGGVSPVSAILVDAQGGRTITFHRDETLRTARVADPDRLVADVDGVLADDHCPEFAAPICAAARRRGLPVVLDIEKQAAATDPLALAATHRIFSRAGLIATSGCEDLAAGLARLGTRDGAFLAVTDGAGPIRWRAGEASGDVPAFAVNAVDTLAAGDVFHGAFALALIEQGDPVLALRFAAAAAALKCTRFGGGAAAPPRGEVERLLRENAPT
jgi:sugar/nucleoside kinase (ribokinase family)